MCTETVARILVFIVNLAFLLVGLALLSLGVLYTVQFSHYIEAIPGDYQIIQYIPTVAIVVGAIIFFISFLGCCGALRSNTCMLSTYAGILFILFLIQIALGVYGLLVIRDHADLRVRIDRQVTALFSRYKETTDITGIIDLIQQNLECCGTTSSQSWISSGFAIPDSCFADANNRQIFTQGCSAAMFYFVTSSVRIIAIVALGISATQIAGAVLALCLSNCIRSNVRKGAYY